MAQMPVPMARAPLPNRRHPRRSPPAIQMAPPIIQNRTWAGFDAAATRAASDSAVQETSTATMMAPGFIGWKWPELSPGAAEYRPQVATARADAGAPAFPVGGVTRLRSFSSKHHR